jgi:hypothetical protein
LLISREPSDEAAEGAFDGRMAEWLWGGPGRAVVDREARFLAENQAAKPRGVLLMAGWQSGKEPGRGRTARERGNAVLAKGADFWPWQDAGWQSKSSDEWYVGKGRKTTRLFRKETLV